MLQEGEGWVNSDTRLLSEQRKVHLGIGVMQAWLKHPKCVNFARMIESLFRTTTPTPNCNIKYSKAERKADVKAQLFSKTDSVLTRVKDTCKFDKRNKDERRSILVFYI